MDARPPRDQDDVPPFEYLSADEDDASYLRRHAYLKPSPVYRNTLALLALIVTTVFLLICYSKLLQNTLSPLSTPRPPAPPLSASSNPVPPIYTRDALIAPKPLSECIKPDNIIDEAVATCRYGQFPRATHDSGAQGMVSESYLAQYKAGQSTVRSKRVTAYNVERDTVWQWDGKRTYAAEWAFHDNRIDDSSVCANYRRGSIEYRECRKGAKVYFREKCRAWGKRWNTDRSDASKATQQRFCAAGESFNPLS